MIPLWTGSAEIPEIGGVDLAYNTLEKIYADLLLAGLSARRDRKVVFSRLTNPVVNLDFYQISNRGRKLPDGADDFTSFLKSYIARWAGRAGVL